MEGECAALWKEITQGSGGNPESGLLISGTENRSQFSVLFSQRDVVTEKTKTFQKSFFLNLDNPQDTPIVSTFPIDVAGDGLFFRSPSGNKAVHIKEEKSNSPNEPNKTYNIEIWSSSALLKSIVTKGKHSHVFTDEFFGKGCWSPDETKFAYTAQPEFPAPSSHYKSDDKSTRKAQQFDFVEDWGESYANLTTSALYILDAETEVIQRVEGIPDNISVGQVCWRNSNTLCFVGFPKTNGLGIKYVYNRQCSLYSICIADEKPTLETLSEDIDHSVKFPRVTESGNKLIYLASPKVGVHNTTSSLRLYDFNTKKVTTVIDIVHELKENEFPGLYCNTFPYRCFVDDDYIIVDSIWYSAKALTWISLQHKKANRLQVPGWSDDASFRVLDVYKGIILVSASTPTKPPTLLVGKIENSKKITWIEVYKHESPIIRRLETHEWKVHTLGEFPNIFQYIAVTPPKSAQPPPLLLYPHGGPHSNYLHAIAYLSLLGFTVILVNFRGSLGFGQALIDFLPGKCGTEDIKDTMECMKDALSKQLADPNKAVLCGGSHGGFIGAHIVTQSNAFKAAVLRNPVTNIAAMCGVTDISDWCVVESGAKSTADVDVMFKCSPMAKVDNVNTPVLFILGGTDKRVPNSQGKQMYFALKNRGIDTSIKMYPVSGHGITKIDEESDNWIQTALWFFKYL